LNGYGDISPWLGCDQSVDNSLEGRLIEG
jgi:hypothetical protein